MSNILILSNFAISKTESNGKIHSYFLNDFNIKTIHNFYFTGLADFDNCNYLSVSPKNALLSKLTFGLVKSTINIQKHIANSEERKIVSNSKSKKPFFHWIRSFAYTGNKSIIKQLVNYIQENKIDTVLLWGCNVPTVYNYAKKIKDRCDVKLFIFTGEDYPLKTYNYLNKKKSIFFHFLRKSLRKHAYFAYKACDEHSYANEELKELYEQEFDLKNGKISYFKSTLNELQNVVQQFNFRITYGGNLYIDRARSIVDIAEHIKDKENVIIDVYGRADEEVLNLFKNYNNIHYFGFVPYEQLLCEYSKSNLILHVEGFSDYYLKDCKYAFSTKIADGLMSKIPFFAYGSEQISGIKFLRKLNPDYTACSKEELYKLDSIIKNNNYNIDYNKVKELFSIKK